MFTVFSSVPPLNELCHFTKKRNERMRGDQLHKRHPKEYSCWKNMKSRSKDEGNEVSREFETFEGFFEIMGQSPGTEYSIDRIDPHNKIYSPGNCRWATKQVQANNRRNTRYIYFNGAPTPLADLARLTGQNYSTLRKRVARGFTDEEIIYGRSAPPATAIEAVDTLSDLRWVGDENQIQLWRGFFHGHDDTPGGEIPWNEQNLSFSEFVYQNSIALHEAVSRNDYSKLHHSFTGLTPPTDAAKRSELLARLRTLANAAQGELVRELFVSDPLVDIEERASRTPWLGWAAGEKIDYRELAAIKRRFDKAEVALPPALASLWKEHKAKFMYK